MTEQRTITKNANDINMAVTKLEYELTTTPMNDPDHSNYTAYGIIVRDDEGNQLAEYPDISTSREYVEGFISILESHDIAVIHIPDLLEDYLE